jgi:hypothetical protein
MIDISLAFYDTLLDIIRLSSPPCMQVRVSDNMDIYIHCKDKANRIRIGNRQNLEKKKKKEILTIVSVRLIHELSQCERERKKEQKSEKKN